jgi:hypothetical protein
MPVRHISVGGGLERKLADLAQKLGRRATVRIGFLEGATYPDGKKVAMIAAIQEFGAPSKGIPPRPFFRNMVAAKKREWPPVLVAQLKANGGDLDKALAVLGDGIAGQLRQSIVDTNTPPLAAATIRRKGFAKPLVDTGHMLQSVDYEVKID